MSTMGNVLQPYNAWSCILYVLCKLKISLYLYIFSIFILLINNIIKIKYLKINPVNLLALLTLLIRFNITGPLLYYLSLSFTISIIYSIINY